MVSPSLASIPFALLLPLSLSVVIPVSSRIFAVLVLVVVVVIADVDRATTLSNGLVGEIILL
jgi:hypothetical protein